MSTQQHLIQASRYADGKQKTTVAAETVAAAEVVAGISHIQHEPLRVDTVRGTDSEKIDDETETIVKQ